MWDRYLVSTANQRDAGDEQLDLFEWKPRKKMKRVYHHYLKWEEFHAGMWRALNGREAERYLRRAIAFISDAPLFGIHMRRVISEWPFSVEHNLTCENSNRVAWLGQAACCLATQSPEHVTREAWHYLNDAQRQDANNEAMSTILEWERCYLT